MNCCRPLVLTLSIFAGQLLVLAAALIWGGPTPPAALESINNPFQSVSFETLPPRLSFQATDGQSLGYRLYPAQISERGSVSLIHGSSASSESMHPLAEALSAAGYTVFTLDMRGHGQSGSKGHIDYVGQLEADLADFVRSVRPPEPSTLAGFSSGGGFVLRFAGSESQSLFGSYLLLAPFISQDAPNQRPNSGGWVSVGIPRIIGLSLLNSFGVRFLNHLPVTAFALNEQAKSFLTPEYDFNLSMNFRPQSDYRSNIAQVNASTAIVAGTADEAFHSDRLAEVVRSGGKEWPIDLVENVAHIPLTLELAALQVIVKRVHSLQQEE